MPETPLSLADFIAALPHNSVELTPSPALPRERQLTHCTEPPPNPYIRPNLEIAYYSPEVLPAPIVLVAAPAAVGKSSLARFLAEQTRNPLWLLERVRLGTFVVSGLIDQMYPESSVSFRELLVDGRTALLLDSLDEAQIKSGGLGSLVELAEDIRTINLAFKDPTTRIVILGRGEAIGILSLMLADLDVAHCVLNVSYFEQEQAKEFIDSKLDVLDEKRRFHRRDDKRELFLQTRDLIFDQFASLLTRTGDADDRILVDSFLGYAPVIEAIAEMLNVENEGEYDTLSSAFTQDDVGGGLWLNLAQVCERILEREQRKWLNSVKDRRWASLPEAGDWYSVPMQVGWVLDGQPIDRRVTAPAWAGPHAADIVESTRILLAEHPFFAPAGANELVGMRRFANTIFEEFCHAFASVHPGMLEHAAIPMKRPSPMFGRLALTMSAERGQSIRHTYILNLLESLMSARRPDQVATVALLGRTSDTASVFVSDDTTEAGQVALNGEALVLATDLADFDIEVPNATVCLGDPSSPSALTITGSVSILAKEIVVSASNIDLTEDAKLIMSTELLTDHTFPSITPVDSPSIAVHCPEQDRLPFSWQGFYRGKLPPTDGEFARATADLRTLCRFFVRTTKRASGHHECYKPSFDKHVQAGRVSDRMVAYCKETGLLVDGPGRSNTYQMRFDTFGFNFDDARHGAVTSSPQLTEFLMDFLQR